MPTADLRARAGSSRPFPSVLVILAAVLLVARVVATVWESRHPADPPAVLQWVPIEMSEEFAVATGRPILYDFSAEWCGPCQAMRAEMFSDVKHARMISQRFVPVRVVDRTREEGRNAPAVDSLQRAYGITAFPTLVVAWPGTARAAKREGYAGAEETARWLAQTAASTRMGGLPIH